VAGFFLFTEHRAHLLGILPYLLLLACLLMHLFMHHGHENHAGHEGHGDGDAYKPSRDWGGPDSGMAGYDRPGFIVPGLVCALAYRRRAVRRAF
jgi:hypothetical protein